MKQCFKGCCFFFFLRQHRGVVFCFRSDEREGFVSIRKEYEFFLESPVFQRRKTFSNFGFCSLNTLASCFLKFNDYMSRCF